MTECTYPALYGLTGGECGQDVRWRMVAGTTACPEILEFRLCSVHTAMCTALPNLPSRLRDSHGHRMEEAILRDLEEHGSDIVLFNYFEPSAADGMMSEVDGTAWVCTEWACAECGKLYGTMPEAVACQYRDLRGSLRGAAS